jgi:uncharacterized BrkB/YihY/UPF0761 family membrane protein
MMRIPACTLQIAVTFLFPGRKGFTGALVAPVLFLIGKFVTGFYPDHSKTGTVCGTAAKIGMPMLWIDYISIILFSGACSTSALAEFSGYSVRLNPLEG